MLKTELKEASGGMTDAQVDEAVRSYIPRHFTAGSGDGKRLDIAPAALAVIELVKTLQGAFGESSPVPKDAARLAAHEIAAVWHGAEPRDILVQIEGLNVDITIRPDFIAKAKAKYEAWRR